MTGTIQKFKEGHISQVSLLFICNPNIIATFALKHILFTSSSIKPGKSMQANVNRSI